MTQSNLPGTGPATANPYQLMEKQVRLLSDLCAQQDRQRVELLQALDQMRADHALQTQKLVIAIQASRLAPNTLPAAQEVQVTDFNMPYLALVGFILKFWLASIPAVLLFMGLVFVVLMALGSGLGTLLSAFR